MRRFITTVAITAGLVLGGATAAAADPSFGPGGSDGQGNNAPQDQGARCHPPGQTSDDPNCK